MTSKVNVTVSVDNYFILVSLMHEMQSRMHIFGCLITQNFHFIKQNCNGNYICATVIPIAMSCNPVQPLLQSPSPVPPNQPLPLTAHGRQNILWNYNLLALIITQKVPLLDSNSLLISSSYKGTKDSLGYYTSKKAINIFHQLSVRGNTITW